MPALNITNTSITRGKPNQGFSLTEVVIASAIGSLLTLVTTDLLIGHTRSGAALDATASLRNNWSRTTHFIESEVALSERVITDPSTINLAQCTTAIDTNEFRFALDIRRDLPPVIYYIAQNPSGSLNLSGDLSLYRCGPGIDREGEYTDTINTGSNSKVDAALLVDGMSSSCQIAPNSIVPSSGSGKSLSYELCLQGLSQVSYAQSISTYSRISPVFSYPSSNTLCNGQTIEGFYQLSGGTTSAETLAVPQGALNSTNSILICGHGGGDTIHGSSADDVLEAGETGQLPEGNAILNGGDGSDHLRGGPGNDLLNGGAGDDVLISQGGNDAMDGGDGDNQYLPSEGNTTISGGDGLDVVYLNLDVADVSGFNACTRSSCQLSYSVEGTASTLDASGIEVVILKDGRHDITQ